MKQIQVLFDIFGDREYFIEGHTRAYVRGELRVSDRVCLELEEARSTKRVFGDVIFNVSKTAEANFNDMFNPMDPII